MFQKDEVKLIPGVYSTPITPSYLGLYLGFRKKVEGVRGGRLRTRIKMGSDGGEEEREGVFQGGERLKWVSLSA